MFKRAHIALLIASLMAVIANGAQAHLSMSVPGQITMPICGPGANQQIAVKTITVSLGDPAPVSGKHESCCGDCMVFAAILGDHPAVEAHVTPRAIPRPANPASSHNPGAPLWPGAPPHGPPSISKL